MPELRQKRKLPAPLEIFLTRNGKTLKFSNGVTLTSNFLKYWFPLCIYAGIIFYLSSIPKPLPEISIPFFDKVLHICEYIVFGILAARAFKNSPREAFIKNFKLFAVLISIFYGISDEFHQGFVSERQSSILDMVADGIGGILGVIFYGRNNPV